MTGFDTWPQFYGSFGPSGAHDRGKDFADSWPSGNMRAEYTPGQYHIYLKDSALGLACVLGFCVMMANHPSASPSILKTPAHRSTKFHE